MNWYWIAGTAVVIAVIWFAALPYYRHHQAKKTGKPS